MSKLQWVAVEGRGKKVPLWKRTAAMDEKGMVFMPGGLACSEMEALICVGFDGTPSIMDGKHIYVPTTWVKENFPKWADVAESIERRMRTICA